MPTPLLYLIALVVLVVVGAVVYLLRQTRAVPVEGEPAPAPPARVVEAVAVMASVKQQPVRAKQIEAAMSAAVRECLANGVSLEDTETIKAAMLAARARVLRGGT